MPYTPSSGHGGPSCYQKMKMGFFMGFTVGMSAGAIFGGFNALRYGIRGRELLHLTGKSMLQSGGTFGTFMAVGTGIRC